MSFPANPDRRPRIAVPAGARQLYIRKPRMTCATFVGYSHPAQDDVYIRHSDGEVYPVSKREIMPAEVALRTRVETLAAARGCSYDDALEELERLFLSRAPDRVVIPLNVPAA